MENKVVLITGASSGIGRATAIKFYVEGATVLAVGRNNDQLTSLKEQVHNSNGEIEVHLADVCQFSQVERLVNTVQETYGKLDVLVTSAGIIQNGSLETTDIENWDKMLDINLRSVFFLMQKCVPLLEKSAGGNIVNVSSVTGTRAFPGLIAYCVSKAGVDQLTRCAALELAEKDIRVNAVNPGVVVSNLHKRGGMNEENYDDFLERSKKTHPLGRVGRPEEIADLIYFLASEKAGWITGATYEIDGGRAQTCAR